MNWASQKASRPAHVETGDNGIGPAVVISPLPGSFSRPLGRQVPTARLKLENCGSKKRPSLPEQFRKNFRIQPEAGSRGA